jgi:hypothetical protein
LYSSPVIIRLIQIRVDEIVEMLVAYIILVRKPEGKRSLGDACFYERLILKCILKGLRGYILDSSGSGCCERDNEPSDSTKWWEFLDWVNDCQLLQEVI